MNILTPEVIFDRFASRLRQRYEDLAYIIYAPGGYEKWAQWELFLSLSEYLVPVVYDKEKGKEWKNIWSPDSNTHLADIRLEYTVGDDNGKIRTDLLVAETPFLYEYVDPETWQIKNAEEKEKLIAMYEGEENYWHYIELKTEWWDISKKKGPEGFQRDVEKIFDKDKTKYMEKYYNPRTYFAMSVVTFFKSEKRQSEIKTEKMLEELKKIGEKCEGPWLFSNVQDYSYLIGTYREFNRSPLKN